MQILPMEKKNINENIIAVDNFSKLVSIYDENHHVLNNAKKRINDFKVTLQSKILVLENNKFNDDEKMLIKKAHKYYENVLKYCKDILEKSKKVSGVLSDKKNKIIFEKYKQDISTTLTEVRVLQTVINNHNLLDDNNINNNNTLAQVIKNYYDIMIKSQLLRFPKLRNKIQFGNYLKIINNKLDLLNYPSIMVLANNQYDITDSDLEERIRDPTIIERLVKQAKDRTVRNNRINDVISAFKNTDSNVTDIKNKINALFRSGFDAKTLDLQDLNTEFDKYVKNYGILVNDFRDQLLRDAKKVFAQSINLCYEKITGLYEKLYNINISLKNKTTYSKIKIEMDDLTMQKHLFLNDYLIYKHGVKFLTNTIVGDLEITTKKNDKDKKFHDTIMSTSSYLYDLVDLIHASVNSGVGVTLSTDLSAPVSPIYTYKDAQILWE